MPITITTDPGGGLQLLRQNTTPLADDMFYSPRSASSASVASTAPSASFASTASGISGSRVGGAWWAAYCTYYTPKLVVIRDWKVALVNRTLQIAIFVYIIVYLGFWEQGYRDKTAVVEKSPIVTVWPPNLNGTKLPPYCCECPADKRKVKPLGNVSDKSYHPVYRYCKAGNGKSSACCILAPPISTWYQNTFAGQMLQVNTAIATVYQTPRCPGIAKNVEVAPSSPECSYEVKQAPGSYYYQMNVEKFNIGISLSAANGHGFSESVQSMKGALVQSSTNKVIKQWPNTNEVRLHHLHYLGRGFGLDQVVTSQIGLDFCLLFSFCQLTEKHDIK
jgi:hypothetical protein